MAKNKTTRKNARTKPRTRSPRRRPGAEVIESQAGAVPDADAAVASEKLTKVNSALIRHRQKARAAAANEPSKTYGSASEFVRQQPVDVPSREVVERAEKLGIKLSQSLVRVIRFHMRHGGVRTPAAATASGAGRRGRPSAIARAAAGSRADEVQFRRLVVEIGLARAHALVTEVENAIQHVIGGR